MPKDDRFSMLPKGAPGRRSFVYIPTQKKLFWREEALSLRKSFVYLVIWHFIFLFTDFYVYDAEIMPIVFELVFIWLCFYNYMTLNKIVVGAHLILYMLAMILAFSHTERVIRDSDSTELTVFLLQYDMVYAWAIFYIGKKYKAHFK